jgi:hypothetical protein
MNAQEAAIAKRPAEGNRATRTASTSAAPLPVRVDAMNAGNPVAPAAWVSGVKQSNN